MLKFRMLCLAAAFALSAHAASPMKKVDMGGVSGWGVGFGQHSNPSIGGLALEYKGPSHEIGFGLSARMENSNLDTADDVNALFIGFNVGAREMIKPMLALSGGFNATTAAVSNWSSIPLGDSSTSLNTIPYRVGFYSALSFEPTKYVALWARNDIISYASPGVENRSNTVAVLGSTQLGLTYYWQS